MNIGILTYYGVHNHGAILQAFALKKTLEDMGHHVEFLTFKRNYDFILEGNEKKYSFSLININFYAKYLINNGPGTFIYNFRKNQILNKFKKSSFFIGDRYSDSKVDCVCIGSDEVFAIDVGINPFFYGHVLKSKRIFSYAGSFGSTTLEDIYKCGCSELINSGFEKMFKIGVRDQNSYDIVKHLSKNPPSLVCDPVILYGYENEISRAKKQTKEKYILLYSYDKNSNKISEIQSLKNFAKRHNYKLYSVGYYHKWCDKNIVVNPLDLLAYFKYAEFIITDTFHGCVLSIVCNKQFAAKLRNNSNKLKFLLEQYNLSIRILTDYNELEMKFVETVDYNIINQLVLKYRNDSKLFLNRCLENNNDKY